MYVIIDYICMGLLELQGAKTVSVGCLAEQAASFSWKNDNQWKLYDIEHWRVRYWIDGHDTRLTEVNFGFFKQRLYKNVRLHNDYEPSWDGQFRATTVTQLVLT